jgi:Bacterial Ig-like domain (group 3)
MARWRIAAMSVAVITGAAFAAPAGDALAVASRVSSVGGAHSAAARPGAVASPSGGTWGLAQAVTGATAAGNYPDGVVSLSCATAGNCGAIGRDTDSSGNSTMFVVSESDGVWGASQGVRGPANLVDGFGDDAQISCASPGDCTAVGDYYAGGEDEQGFVDSQSNGTWAVAQEVPGVTALTVGEHSLLESVSCASAGNCSAGGTYTTAASGSAFLVDETDGTWGSAVEVPGIASLADGVTAAEITSVSCGSPGNCSAGGYFFGKTDGAFVVNETDGTWSNAEAVPGLAVLNTANGAAVSSISCASAGNCSAGGYYSETDSSRPPAQAVQRQAFVVDETDGSWGDAEEVPGTAALSTDHYAETTSVSCASAGNCAAGGVYWTGATSSQDFVVDETAGTWGTAGAVPGLTALNPDGHADLNSISCGSAGNCAVGGSYGGGGADEAFVADETNGSWGAAEYVPGLAALAVGGVQLTSVSCASAGYCSAGGSYYAYGPLGAPFEVKKPFVVNEATGSATALTLTTTAAVYGNGNETGVGASVAVTSAAGGTPTGTVTVAAGPVTICKAPLDAGSGDCTLGILTLPAGSYQLTATYSGDSTYVSSASAGDTFTVSKATSMTSVSISRARLTYGHERPEKLSVTVAAEYAGVPTGRVVVRAGKTTICVMTLRSGRGTCRFSARQLRAGKYHLTVRYAGDRNFVGSSGSGKLIIVRK